MNSLICFANNLRSKLNIHNLNYSNLFKNQVIESENQINKILSSMNNLKIFRIIDLGVQKLTENLNKFDA